MIGCSQFIMDYSMGDRVIPLLYGVPLWVIEWFQFLFWSISWVIGCFNLLMEHFTGDRMLPLLYGVVYG